MSSPVPGCKSIFWLVLLLIVLRLSGVASDNELHKERTDDGAVSPNQEIKDRLLLGVSSILGSKKEVEQFDDLSPEEAKKRLRGIAKRMDANQDGYVDNEEMKKWILKSFTSLALEEAIERFEDADQNGDKLVSWDEHVSESFGNFPFDTEEEKAENQVAMEEEREIFDLADKDKNGLLTVEEYERVAQPQDYPEMHKLIVTHALRRKDSDGDGKVSMEEFLKDEKLSKEHLLEERERFQFELDENKDSVLDFNEFHRWVVPNNDLIADQEVEHLLMRADDNGDGKLSIDEIVDHHETFVSSEVTDFGEHLVKFKDEL